MVKSRRQDSRVHVGDGGAVRVDVLKVGVHQRDEAWVLPLLDQQGRAQISRTLKNTRKVDETGVDETVGKTTEQERKNTRDETCRKIEDST